MSKNHRLFDMYREMVRLHEQFDGMEYEVLILLRKLGKMTKKHHRLCERYCNEGDFDENLINEEESRIKRMIDILNKGIMASNPNVVNKFRVEFQGDPRGCTARIFLDNGDGQNPHQLWEIFQ
jgi:hypothetical protein